MLGGGGLHHDDPAFLGRGRQVLDAPRHHVEIALAQRHVGPIAVTDMQRALAHEEELVLVGMAVPEEYGGGGVDDFRFNAIIAEELARAGIGGAGLGITLHNDITTPYFLAYTNDEQRRRWLPGIASGELVTAVAMTEPGIGSDLAWNIVSTVMWDMPWTFLGSNVALYAGYKAYSVEIDENVDGTDVEIALQMNGPAIGVGFQF